jgi:hypothetical protein
MLSGTASAFYSFRRSRRIDFVSKIFATIVFGRYVGLPGLSKFLPPLLRTPSPPRFPQ